MMLTELNTVDAVVLALALLGALAYYSKRKPWAIVKDPSATAFANGTKAGKSRNIVEKLEQTGKNCVVFYGSQTGTAEDYASRLAKEGKGRFGLETMIADLEEYDFESLDAFPTDKIAIFVLATYGEGEPTDNAVDFYELLTADDVALSNNHDPPLGNLSYIAFGLGNSTYENFNSMVRNVDKALQKLGAHRIGNTGEGDDGAGTMEEDFLAWKDHMWSVLAKNMGLNEREITYEPAFNLIDRHDLSLESPEVYLGEPNRKHLEGTIQGPFDIHNPFIAPIAEAYELFTVKDRNCVHMEFDLSGSNIAYQTGDHVAVWPTNPTNEVDRFLDTIGLAEKRNDIISLEAIEPTTKAPFPTPTTYVAITRYYLEICAPVSRQFVSTLAAFSPNAETKAEMTRLGNDKDYFHENTHFYNIARLLATVSKGVKWTNIPFSAFIEGLNKLQPRYYSISSSSLVQPNKISITATVKSEVIPGRKDRFCGVATNYILALKQRLDDSNPRTCSQHYELMRARNNSIRVPIHIRRSNFKLPADPNKPVIMIGPGTGVAPFRAFVQERAKAHQGAKMGRMFLFFGCRKSTEDFIYKDEWAEYKKNLGDKLQMITAFSRQTSKKVYVQHLLQERAKEMMELLQQHAFVYVCGDATNMAREVHAVLVQIIATGYGLSVKQGEEVVKQMRASNQYQEDVWA